MDKGRLFIGDGVQTVNLTIEYTGEKDAIEIEGIESNRQWIKIKDNEAAGSSLERGTRTVVQVEVNALSHTDGYHVGEIMVFSDIGTRFARVEVIPRPDIHAAINSETVLLAQGREARLSGRIEVRRGGVTIKEMATSVPWARCELAGRATIPHRIDARRDNRLDFNIVINEGDLLRDIERTGKQTPAEYIGQLTVKYEELEPARKYPFYVTCKLPPAFVIAEEEEEQIRMDVFLGRQGELSLTARNGEQNEKGRADLEIREIRVSIPWLRLAQQTKLPIKLRGGQHTKLTFSANGNEAKEGYYVAEITFVTNLEGEEREKTIRVDVDVRQMPVFDRSVAIDFGTTNSCCAVMKELGNKILVRIDHTQHEDMSTVASSAIAYLDLVNGDKKVYEIGNVAYNMSLRPEASAYTRTQIKRRLGENEEIPISFLYNPARKRYKPKEIVADIVHKILERAENEIKHKINKCTISHPSRFSLRQISELKDALISQGIPEKNISTIHEPVAAALEYIQRGETIDQYKQYNLMVFDFGGGTTDITLLRVTNEYEIERRLHSVTPEPLGAVGDRWLGGEDVTDMVMELALEKCLQVLRSLYPDAKKIVIPCREKKVEARYRNIATNERINLRTWAEYSKIALSDLGDGYREKLEVEGKIENYPPLMNLVLNDFNLTVLIDNERKEQTFRPADIVPRMDELNQKLRPRLEKVVEMMKKLAENNRVEMPDIILLAGKSSALPIVEQVIREHFPKSKIDRPDDLKKCVAMGACQMYSPYLPGKAYIKLPKNGSLEATTSSLGIGRQYGHLRFQEIIPAGVPIPAEGLRKVLDDLPPLERRYRIPILENTGLENDTIINGKPNPDIRVLREFHLEQNLAEWEQANNMIISDESLSRAQIAFEVTPNLTAKLMAIIPGIEEPIEFEAVEVPGL
jgi:molecular chaperone DnaK (HSP70)